ncbi:MAG: hypothetical protein GVY20_09155 [Bacteroidetes bacterium]|jgi:hypothetical protein|nr:hypothetical protein [Bacteroidota bacterium]
MNTLKLAFTIAVLILLTSCNKYNLPNGMTEQDLIDLGLQEDVVFKDDIQYVNPEQASTATIDGEILVFPIDQNPWTENTYQGLVLWSPRGKTWNQNFAKRIQSIRRDGGQMVFETTDVNMNAIFQAVSFQLGDTPGEIDCPIQSPAIAETYDPETANLFPAYSNGMWGFIDQNGSWVFEPTYYKAEKFSDDFAAVQQCKDGFWGYINTSGEVAIEASFVGADPFSEGHAPVTISEDVVSGDVLGMINSDGEIIFSDSLNTLRGFSEGLASAETIDGQTGFIDTNGNWVIQPSYRDADNFSEGIANARKKRSRNGDWGFINKNEEWVIEPQFNDARAFSDGLAPVSVGVFEYTYINKEGKIMFDRRFRNAHPFSDGLALVEYEDAEYNDYLEYINKEGETVIDGVDGQDFCRAYPFENGLALVHIQNDESGCGMGRKVDNVFLWVNGTMAYINKDGETVYEYTENQNL